MLNISFEPFPVLHTERLLLRELTLEDAEAIFRLRSDARVLEFLGREPAKDINAAKQFIATIKENVGRNESVLWGICLKEMPESVIGTICLWQMRPWDFRTETGYVLLPEYWRKGIMKEALTRVISYAFEELGFHSLEAKLAAKNQASAALLESTGFVREGLLSDDYFFNGSFTDTAIYTLINTAPLKGIKP